MQWEKNKLKSPPSFDYPAIPPNWESRDTLAANKPATHVFIHDFSQGIWGGITDNPSEDQARIEQYPNPSPHIDLKNGIAKMPYSYWKRGLDSYTQVMQIVDTDIGNVLDTLHSLTKDVIENTVIVFAADHGEYSGAHGMVQGKMATVYEEAWHIPLIVVDPSYRFTGDIDTTRTGLTSSVDLLNLLVSIGNRGTQDWMAGYLKEIYGDRHDMISMLKSANAPGRPYVLYATDEIVPDVFIFDFNRASTHVLGLRKEETKLGVYDKWLPLTSRMIPQSVELEYYDYSTEGGRLELDNLAKNGNDPRAKAEYELLVREIIPNELQEPLPPPLRTEQEKSKIAHLLYREYIAHKSLIDWLKGDLTKVLGYGAEF